MSYVSVDARINYNSDNLHRRASSWDYEKNVKARIKTDPRIAAIMEEIADEEMDRLNNECRRKYDVKVDSGFSVGLNMEDVFESILTKRPITRVSIGGVTIKHTGSRVQF